MIDGDTIDVVGDGRLLPKNTVARVRLLEIDTPERGSCYAAQASARTTELVPPGSTVRLERDDELMDPYDRYLLYVWNDRGVFVNESLARSGHAEAVLFEPNDRYWTRISSAADSAQAVAAGLWAACPKTSEPPTAPGVTTSSPPAETGLTQGPPASGSDVDCEDLSGPVVVGPDDPHRLDRDGDGIGCESD
ncbi:thermonuclease family protein [Streptomyces sp. NPDC051207]|uniref:thermonuclease family protein n=1 Tax=Streptomyces sp. NPDC051207 TaxID=3154641 RepID=UPI00342552DD